MGTQSGTHFLSELVALISEAVGACFCFFETYVRIRFETEVNQEIEAVIDLENTLNV